MASFSRWSFLASSRRCRRRHGLRSPDLHHVPDDLVSGRLRLYGPGRLHARPGSCAFSACTVTRQMPFIISGGIAGGCAVPGIMATRTLRSPKEKLATCSPPHFMSCGAKLPVFLLLVAAFFPHSQAQMMFMITLVAWLMGPCWSPNLSAPRSSRGNRHLSSWSFALPHADPARDPDAHLGTNLALHP